MEFFKLKIQKQRIKLLLDKMRAEFVRRLALFYFCKIVWPFNRLRANVEARWSLLYHEAVKNYEYFFNFIQPWYSRKNLWIGIILASLAINILSLAFPIFLLQIYDRVIVNQSVITLILLCAGVVSALVVESLLAALRGLIISWCAMRYEYKNNLKAFDAFMDMPAVKLSEYSAGRFLEEFNAVRLLKNFYGGRGLITFCELPFISIFIFFIIYLSHSLAFILLLLIALQACATFWLSRDLTDFDLSRKDIINKRNSFLVNVLAGIATVKAFSMEALMLRRYERLQDKMSAENLNITLSQANLNLLSSNISQISIVLIAIFGSVSVLHHHLTLGALTACMILTGRVNAIVNQGIELASQFQQVKLTNLRYQRLLLQRKKPILYSRQKINAITGEIKLNNVSYKDRKTDQILLSDINLTVSPGQMVCLQGEDQAGKSLLLQLMRGLIEPYQGEVLLDGHPFYEFEETLIDEKLLYLPANPVLFNGTLIENLTLFDPEKTIQAKDICNKLRLEMFIDRLPQGYETHISMDSNEFLPAGIKQLINLVRAITKDPQVLLLDEAILFLDYNSERAFRNMLNELKASKTIVIVNHRPSICSLAMRHYSLQGGRLLETQHQTYANN